MKYLKILSLAAVAAMALMAFAASSASATAIYNGASKLATGSTIAFSIPAGKEAVLTDTSGNSLDKCTTSTAKGELKENGPKAGGPITELTWGVGGKCTFTTNTVTKGGLEAIWTGGTNAEIKSNAKIEVTINSILGDCIYGVEGGKSLGTLATNSSTAATFTANAVAEKLGGPIACPTTAKWTGTYVSTEPVSLRVEES